MRRRLALIHNPVAGRGRAAALAAAVAEACRARGAEVRALPTAAAGDARRLARENAGGFDALVALGGDGTVAEVLNGAADAFSGGTPPENGPVPVAIVPAGTANVMARALGLPKKVAALAEVLLGGPAVPLDLAAVTPYPEAAVQPAAKEAAAATAEKTRFFLCAGCGLDAEIVDAVHAGRRGAIHMGRYAAPAARAFFRRDRPSVTVSVDGRAICGDAAFVLVGNVNRYGGFFRFFGDDARFDDGRLDVVCLRGRGWRDWLRFGWRGLRGRWPEDPRTVFAAGRSVTVRAADGPARYQLNGDPGGDLPVRFDVLPSAARIVRPKGESAPRTRPGVTR